MTEKLRLMEIDMASRLKDHREQQMAVVANFEEEKTRLLKNGGSTAEDARNLVHTLLSQIERKVDEEVGNRQRDLGETKDALE